MSPEADSRRAASSSVPSAGSAGEAALRLAFESGRAEHAAVGLAESEFAARAWALSVEHVTAGTAAPDDERVADFLRGCAAADLYLAVACETDVPGSWQRLNATLLPRLTGLARRRSLSAADADAAATEVLADMALPATWSRSRRLIGTFDGTGSLFAWGAVLLVRRLSRNARSPWQARRVHVAPEVAAEGGTPGSAALRRDPNAPDRVLADREVAARFRAAFEDAWTTLSASERAAVAFKHRDGLAQRAVARILGVGEAWVSRLLTRAVEKLSAGVRERVDAAGGAGDFARLEDALRRSWTSLSPTPPPPSEVGSPMEPLDGSA